jgi:hypothetical protein
LNSFIASVDDDGNATLATAASATVTSVAGWAGVPVPEAIRAAIKMMVEFYYEHGGAQDADLPRVVEALLDPYRNLVV